MAAEHAPQNGSVSPGGSGGSSVLSTEDRESVQNTRMIERALRERWPITPEMRQALVNRAVKLGIDPSVKNREALSAIRSVVAMDAQNVALATKAADKIVPDLHQHEHEHHHEMAMQEIRGQLDQLRHNAEYRRQRREATNGCSDLPRTHGSNGQQGPMANGSAPESN